ncbi:MAG: hypothetical protein ACFFD4_40185 [Candidatus Odinarchaeota archaeon]
MNPKTLTFHDLKQLTESENLVDVIFNKIREIWTPSSANVNIQEHYQTAKVKIANYERLLAEPDPLNDQYGQLPSIYSIIAEKGYDCGGTVCLETQKRDDLVLIIMDGLSLREGILLEFILKRKYQTELSYTLSVIPSDTDTFKVKVFGTSNITKLPNLVYVRDEFTYEPTEDRYTIFTRFPDALIHDARKGYTVKLSYTEIYDKTMKLLSKILSIIAGGDTKQVLVTSDHGYIDFSAGTWGLSKKEVKIFRDYFKGESFIPYQQNESLKYLENNGRIIKVRNHYIVSGRYCWKRITGNFSHRKHGGISLMENLCPVIKIILK